jgi:hypothetical protein
MNDDSNQAHIGDGNILSAVSVSVSASSTRDITLTTDQIAVGAGALGASFTRLTSDGATIAEVGDNVDIGQGAGSVGSLSVAATSNVDAHATTFALATGGITVTANFSFVDVTPMVRAGIGANSDIDVTA